MAKPMTKTEWLNWLEKAWDEAQQAAWPEKKEWVGLTDEDMEVLFLNEDGIRFARHIEAKLKEKNS